MPTKEAGYGGLIFLRSKLLGAAASCLIFVQNIELAQFLANIPLPRLLRLLLTYHDGPSVIAVTAGVERLRPSAKPSPATPFPEGT